MRREKEEGRRENEEGRGKKEKDGKTNFVYQRV